MKRRQKNLCNVDNIYILQIKQVVNSVMCLALQYRKDTSNILDTLLYPRNEVKTELNQRYGQYAHFGFCLGVVS